MRLHLVRFLIATALGTLPQILSAAEAAEVSVVPVAAITPAVTPSHHGIDFEKLWRAPTIYKNDKADVLNELRIVGRLHLDNYILDSNLGRSSDFVSRRARLGLKARLFHKLEAQVQADFNLEGGGAPFYTRLTDAYLAWKFSDAATLTVGKQSLGFGLDGGTSAAQLMTIDRSNVANNLWFTEEYLPGVSVKGKSGKWSYATGVYSGGRSDSEFGKFNGGVVVFASVGRDISAQLGVKQAVLRADYVYNQPDAKSTFTRPYEHVGALVLIIADKKWGVSADVMAGKGSLGQSDAAGFTLLPWYNISSKFQVVGRFSHIASSGQNGLRPARYENVVNKGRGDVSNELYAGLNYYLHGHNLKLQTGVTYANMRDRANDGGAYDGVTWTTALRLTL
jgi:phosphate-selective porin OprO and OprP